MTEGEWLTGIDPLPMLEHVKTRASDRKLRLFAAACTRRVWALVDEHGRAAVETAERFADGLAGAEELRRARLVCRAAGGQAAWYAAASNPFIAAGNACRSAQSAVAENITGAERAAQAALAREVFGNPFRNMGMDPACLQWNDGCVRRVAQSIYENRRFGDLPDLGTLLQEAGSSDAEILSHCRRASEHVRGCWVVDLVLGRA